MVVSGKCSLPLLLSVGLLSWCSPASASLIIQSSWASLEQADFLSTLAHSMAGDVAIEVSASSSATHDPRQDDEHDRRLTKQQQLPDLSDRQTTSSANTTSAPTDGGAAPPGLWEKVAALFNDADAESVVAFKTMIPPDPPPTGLLKPPRASIKACV